MDKTGALLAGEKKKKDKENNEDVVFVFLCLRMF